jgi:hypothetical protein
MGDAANFDGMHRALLVIDRIVKDFTLYRRRSRRAGLVARLARVRQTSGRTPDVLPHVAVAEDPM